ncbi:MAG: HD domain-containing protein [Bdellovibrionaceae bacterium]|nr:HD domain-containing protein [Pseudobdellovibrionaceae bacterium]
MDKIFISQLQDKQTVTSTFLAKNKVLLKDKRGKSYVSFLLSDSSGDVDAKIWDNADSLEGLFQSGDIILVKGAVQMYQNRKQFVVHKVERFDGGVDLRDYVKSTNQDPEDIYRDLIVIVEEFKNEPLKQLILDTLSDPTIKPLLMVAPAAKTIHHAKIGGLLEHILSIAKLCRAVSSHYSQLDGELLIFGAIFHDIGKIWELKIDDSGIAYTDKGRLLGHMAMAVELIEKKCQKIFNFPEELKDICKHMVLSHHGKQEYGSPKVPQTLEAYVLWMLDDLDSKVDAISQAMTLPMGDGKWSQYSTLFERHFLIQPLENHNE